MDRPDIAAPRDRDAEAHHVTILKCDLVGSTQTKKRLDLEAQLEFQQGFERVVTDVASRYGGRIQRFEGDGALIVSGLPEPKEDAPESAVRMGIELVNAVRKAGLESNIRLQLRVGIASGLIAVVKRPLTPLSDPIAGMTIEMAERLRAFAGPDQVVIADATKRLAAGFFLYEDLGTVQAKGFDEGIRAWRVVGESQVASRFEAQRFDPTRGEIIGRTEVLARLSEAWNSSRSGIGQTVCLVGDAGIGKSRLALAALDAASRDGAAVLKVDCTPSTVNTPLFPIGVMLRRTANIMPASSEAEKRTLVQQLLARLLSDDTIPAAFTYLASLFGLEDVALPANVAPAEVRDQTISILVQMLTNLAAKRPLALLCEDLHWVDDTTARVIARIGDVIADLPVLVIITTRPNSEEPPFDLSRFAKIALQPLDPSTAAELVRSVAKDAPLPDETVRRIVDRCEGVPLVLEEVTRNALEVAGRSGETDAATGSEREVPAPLQLIVQSRLSRFPQLAPIVQSASVLGREFSVRLLEKMAGAMRKSEVAKAIELLTQEGLFAKAGSTRPERAHFKHVMICEAVYNTLLGSDHRRLHSEVADILTRDYKGTPDAAPDVIAEHLRKAARFIESIRVRLAASNDTAARGAYVETEGNCVSALALIDEVKDPTERATLQFRLLVQLGVAQTGQHGYSAAAVEDTYRRAHAVCGDSAEAEMLYPIIRGLATVNLVRGNLAIAHDLSTQGLKLAMQSKRTEFCLDAMSVICYATLYFGRLEDCRSWIKRCLQLYRAENGDRLTYPVPQDAGTAAIALLPTVAWLLGDSHAAEEAIQEGLAHVERLNRDFDKALLHSWIAGTRYTQRRYSEAIEHAGIAVGISQKHGYREWYGTGALLALLAQCALKADPQAVEQATASCMAFAREGVGLNASYYLWGLARGHARAGAARNARQMVAEGLERAEASGETRMNAELLILRAELEHDDAKAIQMLGSALTLADEQGAIPTALRAAATIALRSPSDLASTECARATLNMLDGRSPYPTQRDWMLERRAALQVSSMCTRQRRYEPGSD